MLSEPRLSLAVIARYSPRCCFDADTGKDSAREIREYFIPDFSNWKNHATTSTRRGQPVMRDEYGTDGTFT